MSDFPHQRLFKLLVVTVGVFVLNGVVNVALDAAAKPPSGEQALDSTAPDAVNENGGNTSKPNAVPKRPLVKVGDHYLNPASIRYVSVDEESLVVVFGPGAENRIVLNERDSWALRSWLDVQASVVRHVPARHLNHASDANHANQGNGVLIIEGPRVRSPLAAVGGPAAHLVKVGNHYFNPTRLRFAAGDGESFVVTFGPGLDNRVALKGRDAEGMRHWLDAQASAIRGATSGGGRKGTQTEGVPVGGSNGFHPDEAPQKSGNVANPDDGSKRPLVKVGGHYFNPASIQFAAGDGGPFVVVYGPGLDNRIALKGSDAVAMRSWLDDQSVTLISPSKGRRSTYKRAGPARL